MLGYYIYSCQKMRYKGDYSPSYLADPVHKILLSTDISLTIPQETYAWFPLKACVPLLDRYRYACFSKPEHSIEGNIESDIGIPSLTFFSF